MLLVLLSGMTGWLAMPVHIQGLAMFKIIFFLWRKPSLNRHQFIDYYENRHAPLGSSLSPPMPDYRRNYPIWSEPQHEALGGFDVMTEIWHNNRATFEKQLTGMQVSPNQEIMAEDENKFIVRARQLFVAIDEHGSFHDDADHYLAQARNVDRPIRKRLRFVRAAAGMDAMAFHQAYENEAVARNQAAIPGLVAYRRNYACYDDPYTFTGGTSNVTATQDSARLFDLVEEIWHVGETQQNLLPAFVDIGGNVHEVGVDEYRSPGGKLAAPLSASH